MTSNTYKILTDLKRRPKLASSFILELFTAAMQEEPELIASTIKKIIGSATAVAPRMIGAKEAGALIGKKAQYMKDHAEWFPSAIKSKEGRKEWAFKEDEIVECYNNQIKLRSYDS